MSDTKELWRVFEQFNQVARDIHGSRISWPVAHGNLLNTICNLRNAIHSLETITNWQRITPDNLPPEGVPVFVKTRKTVHLVVFYKDDWWHISHAWLEEGAWHFRTGTRFKPYGEPTHYHPFPSLEVVE